MEYKVGWTCSKHEADNKCGQYIRKKFLMQEISSDMYTLKSIILKLILNKQGVREWIRFTFQERAQSGCSEKIGGFSWLRERLISYKK